LNLFCIDEKGKIYYNINMIFNAELCCGYCIYLNLHKGHKVIPITDEEKIKKENININKQFEENTQKVTNLKDKIENEIIEIDKLYEKVDKEIIEYFKRKHEELIKKEKEIKDNLQNEVTETKEKLKEYLSFSNKIIKDIERINKGIKSLKKEEKNMLKILTYISKINKNEKEIKKLNDTCMRNIKIIFDEKENKVKYEEYFFNGIPSPKDIEFKDVEGNSLKINWTIDNKNLLNIDKNKIKFKIEIRKENSNDNFNKIYEGNEMNNLINNLDSNTNYEIRICSVYNDINSIWSEIKKVKTNEYISLILGESKRYDEFIRKIFEWSGYNNMKLLYRGTRDGMDANYFHNKCNNQGPTISLFKNDKGFIFGGYASTDWTSYGDYKSAPDSFIFSLTNIHGTEPTKFPNSDSSYSIYDNSVYGPTFGYGCDIRIYKNSSYSNFPTSYKDILGKGKSIFTGDLNNNNTSFKLKEIEVFKIFK